MLKLLGHVIETRGHVTLSPCEVKERGLSRVLIALSSGNVSGSITIYSTVNQYTVILKRMVLSRLLAIEGRVLNARVN